MSADLPDRKVAAAPPPRRKVVVDLDDTLGIGRPDDQGEEQGRGLELSGFTNRPTEATEPSPTPPTTTPQTRRPAASKNPRQPAPNESGARKTTLSVPVDLLERLRTWTKDTGRTNADGILSAMLDCLDDVRNEFAPSPADAERASLGLAPISKAPAIRSTQSKTQLGLFIQPNGLAALDASAEELSLSRSALVSELLERYLP